MEMSKDKDVVPHEKFDSGFDDSFRSSEFLSNSSEHTSNTQPSEMESDSPFHRSDHTQHITPQPNLVKPASLHTDSSPHTSSHSMTKEQTSIERPGMDSMSSMSSTDSGLGESLPSVNNSLSSNNKELSVVNQHLLATPPTSGSSYNSVPSVSEVYDGKPEEFLRDRLGPNWLKWDPVRDIREKLGHLLLEMIRSILWDQDINDKDKEFEALDATRENDERAVALAVFVAKNHKQLNTMNRYRQTILHLAAEFCPASLVRLIITRGADGAIADAWGDTPLHIAARLGRADVIKALTTTLTKPEVRHPYYRVPYKSLPQDNVQSYNHDGRTPVHLAAQTPNSPQHRDALMALKKCARADMDYRRLGDGYAPSHIAIDNDDYECLHTCLKMDADSEVRNFKSETPQQLAHLCGSEKMVKLCQQYGAGAYQLNYADTEPVSSDEEEMDVDDEDEDECPEQPMAHGISHRMQQMVVH